MVTLHSVLTVLQVLLAAGTVLTPLYYEKYSLFARRARKAVDSLDKTGNAEIINSGTVSISPDDKGFSQLLSVLKEHGRVIERHTSTEQEPVNITVTEIGQIWASRDQLAEFFGWDPENFDKWEAIIYTSGEPKFYFKDIDLTTSPVLRNSDWNRRPGFRVVDEQMVESVMRSWISDTARDRAHFLTAIIVIFWTTLLFVN